MKGLLIRVGIDQAYGGWNAPVDPETLEFVYVPIPESSRTVFHSQLETTFEPFADDVERFRRQHGCNIEFPMDLRTARSHLDPDFAQLTYGDNAEARGSRITTLHRDDIIVFFAGLRPIRPCPHKLIYAIVGSYVIDEVVRVEDVPRDRWPENAHTRKATRGRDVIVRARRGESGRLARCLPIGEFRDRAYRVRHELLEAWGGLDVKDGYVQRSAVPPFFSDPNRFSEWYNSKKPQWLEQNN